MILEVVIDGPRNQNLYFRPLQRSLRGTFDVNRIAEPHARTLITDLPWPIPGLRVVLDFDKRTAAIVDPLYAPEHKVIREKIEAQKMKLGPEREELLNVDLNTWAFWLRRAVANGVAKIVAGKFPEIDEAKARKNFVIAEETNPRDTLIDRLVAIMYASLPPERRKEVAELVGAA
jgi:hypothetical protein